MDTPPTAESPLQALVQSYLMIIVSEIGDKTFLIAAILAMRHPRALVFAGAFGALLVMSVLSAALGHLLPALIPRKWTQALAAVLFIVFGAKMWTEARAMEDGHGKMEEEMREAQEEIEEWAEADGPPTAIPLEAMEDAEGGKSARVKDEGEEGSSFTRSPSRNGNGSAAGWSEGARNFCSLMLGPVFVQAFVLTFLGEWGDRSQIATIALGAAHNVYLVSLGTLAGHSCCTAVAVIGGRYVSTKISVKHVTFGGSILFLLFGVIYLYEAFVVSAADVDMAIPISAGAASLA